MGEKKIAWLASSLEQSCYCVRLSRLGRVSSSADRCCSLRPPEAPPSRRRRDTVSVMIGPSAAAPSADAPPCPARAPVRRATRQTKKRHPSRQVVTGHRPQLRCHNQQHCELVHSRRDCGTAAHREFFEQLCTSAGHSHGGI